MISAYRADHGLDFPTESPSVTRRSTHGSSNASSANVSAPPRPPVRAKTNSRLINDSTGAVRLPSASPVSTTRPRFGRKTRSLAHVQAESSTGTAKKFASISDTVSALPLRKRRRRNPTNNDRPETDYPDSVEQSQPPTSAESIAVPRRTSESVSSRATNSPASTDESSVTMPRTTLSSRDRRYPNSRAFRRPAAPQNPKGLRRSTRVATS